MPPIAEEMAGGGTGPPGGGGPTTQQHPQPHTKKKGHQRPRAPSFRRDLSKDKADQQDQQERGKLKPSHLLSVDRASEDAPSRSGTSILNDLSSDSGTPESSINMMALRSVQPKVNIQDVGKMDRYSTDPGVGAEFFKKEPCLYSHRMFERAAKIFLGLKEAREAKLEKRSHGAVKGFGGGGRMGPMGGGGAGGRVGSMGGGGGRVGSMGGGGGRVGSMVGGGRGGAGRASADEGAPPDGGGSALDSLDFKNVKEQKLTYELAFSSLKFEMVFEDMLEDCAFFSVYPDLRDVECLVMVVLWDYQSRKFQPRIQFDADELVEEVAEIERAILDQKVKLAASLARRRIKESAPSIDCLLPEKFRSKGSASKPLPVHAWVNTAKISPSELLNRLKLEKYTQLWTPPKTAKEFPEKSFYLDPHCSDLLVFSVDCNALLQDHALIEQGYLVKQDKSSCLAAHSVVHLLGDEQDVIVVNPGAGTTSAHLGALLKTRKGGVLVVSNASPEDYNKMMRCFELLNVTKYVKVIQQNFLDMDPDDVRLKSVRAALVTADCSKSAISNIVNYIVTEGENLKMLQDMSEQSDDTDDHLSQLQNNHVADLRQALKLPRIQGVTYLTRSVHSQENEAVVQRAIEYVNMVQVHHHLRPWRVIPPVLPFSSEEVDDQVGIQGKTAFFKPSSLMNGCFIVCIAREPEDTQTVRAKALRVTKKEGGSSSGSSGSTKVKKTSIRKKSTNKPHK